MHRLPVNLIAGVLLSACGVTAIEDEPDCSTGKCDLTRSLWRDVTESAIGKTGEWSNKVELADVDGDGRVDIVFANGGDYSTPSSEPAPNRVFANQGAGKFREITQQVFGETTNLARVIKVRDVSGDGIADILVGTTYETQSRLLLGTGGGRFNEVTTSHLPQRVGSIGDLEIGDVDGDGDLDVVLADWGPGDPFESTGAPLRLWLNSGDGHFSEGAMPDIAIRWSWDIELVDLDNDFDLDVVAACKVCTGGKLYLNDGAGSFRDASSSLPQFTNNYDFEPLDIDGDGFLDLLTINDGDVLTTDTDRKERVFLNNQRGGFTDGTAKVWPDSANVGADDNVASVLDVDSDGDPDFVIGSLDGEDRLLVNDGGKLELRGNVFEGAATPGTLGLALADLDGDHKLDAVQAQGELADDERVYLGSGIAADTAAPHVDLVRRSGGAIVARVHDTKMPVMPHDFRTVEVRVGGEKRAEMRWYGGALWRAPIDIAESFEICATDAAGNTACAKP